MAGRDIDADELHRLAVSAAWKRSALYAGCALGIVVLFAALVWSQFRPQPLERSLKTFVRAWNRSDVGEVVAFFERARAGSERGRLEQAQKSRHWDALPELAPAPELEVAPGEQLSTALPFADGHGSLVLDWVRDGRSWTLAALDLPPPPIDRVVQAFSEAWNRADPDALAALYREDSRARFRGYFERLVAKRGWSAGYPQIRSSQVMPLTARSADVWFQTAGERFLTQWIVRDDDSWALVTLDPPE
ncbi:MAG: hypothetical protein EXS08_03555 [Planctomycetes bacterium]|nr:hypothetical protein [Planctomycetota bacterium]